ncbi:MAG: hypothetical protein A2W19_08685 [Spirochaetes bacterium RBG_16_49_21]|nr:MAG: hypothetical protein A2W19_08685 [Spirochaetes bacterium RBG_16_49_21]
MDKHQLYTDLNQGVLFERLAAFERNLGKNRALINSYGGLRRILPGFEGKTAVVIGAGPSLERHFDLLRKFQERRELAYIAADMALRPLLKSGVRPGYVFSCETNPVDFFGGLDTGRIHLIAFSCMSHLNLRRWRGDISFYNWMIKGALYDRLWNEAGRDLGFVATGGLVTTQAVAFALGCGISGLILVGNDLGYGHRFYVRESVPFNRNCLNISRFAPLDALEMSSARRSREYRIKRDAEIFNTTSQFLAGKMWLEDLFGNSRIPVYDASSPGCSEKYVAKIELKDFLYSLEGGKKRKRRRA